MISKRMKAIAVMTAAAIALTCAGHAPAFANAAPGAKQASQTSTEFSSRNRGYGYYPRHRNDAAAAAIVGAIITGVAAYAAAREYRKARERSYPYGYAPYAQPYGYDPYD
jgi:type IV secretory pathway VirB2 component (pilin)